MGFLKRLFGKKKTTQPEPQDEPKTTITKDEKTRKYHVSMNNDEKSEHYKMWRVRKESSDKTIKYFKTQKEAITYAEDLAKQAKSSVVIHKLDGSIRKQNYS